MSDVDGGITRPKDGKKLYKIEITGKLDDTEWETFKTCIKACVDQFPTKLTVKFK
jgi:hypothetical protein